MAIIEDQESEIGLTKQRSSQTYDDELCFPVPQTFRCSGSPPSTDAIIIIDDDDDETLDYKNKKSDTLTTNTLGSLPSTDTIIIDDEEQETLEPKKKKRRLGSWWDCDESPFDELSIVVKGLPKAKENDGASSVYSSCFSSTDDLHEKKRKKDDERSSSSSHQEVVDLSEDDECVGAGTSKGDGHVSLEELGVTVEDLKNMPWEAFDPTWEIRSETMDPWLGGYVKDMLTLS